GKPIDEVKRELGIKEVIKLASNESALAPSKKAISAAQKAMLSVNRYPDGGCFYLKGALSKRFGISTKNIIIGNGSDEIIILAIRAFLEKGEEVIIADPTFLIYEAASEIAGAKIKYAPLKNLKYDVKKIVSLITKKTKIIFIANPDNPTGSYITKEEIAFLISRTPKNTILYFDEAYFEFAEDLKDFPDTTQYLKKNRNIIISRTFSKAYSLAGLRVGYAFADKDVIDCLNLAREPFNVNSIGQAAAIAALGDKKYIKKAMQLIKKGKKFISKELETLGINYVPSATNFLLIDVGKKAKEIYIKLLKKGVIVREMSGWKLDNFIRVTVGTEKENRKFISVLKEITKVKR
ncbi:MAG: histidinol-phosphate transaminase, partial [Candidatus Omnitrophota bacterium]